MSTSTGRPWHCWRESEIHVGASRAGADRGVVRPPHPPAEHDDGTGGRHRLVGRPARVRARTRRLGTRRHRTGRGLFDQGQPLAIRAVDTVARVANTIAARSLPGESIPDPARQRVKAWVDHHAITSLNLDRVTGDRVAGHPRRHGRRTVADGREPGPDARPGVRPPGVSQPIPDETGALERRPHGVG
jgi:hypothetical protein